jgi:hypothetical protein
MRLEDLERFLERGYELGFVKQTGSDDYLGWILLSKQKPNERALSILLPGEEPEYVAHQELIRQKPYHVRVVEISRAAHESDGYGSNEDYRQNDNHYFANLEEVERFVQVFGHALSAIQWRIDIDAP